MSDYRKQGINADGQAQVQIDKVEQNFAPVVKRATAEETVLKAVDQEVAGRLAQSLHERVYIELHKQEDPQQVVRPWDLNVKEGTAPSQRCEPGTSIESIFDRRQIGGRLLVLGAPGSGKTTMLLQLARVLVARSQADAAAPVPVLLNLSAWKTDYQDIQSWMVADLKLKYGVRGDVAQRWIADKRMLPLLDGLDELVSERQATCVQALNDFLTTAWVGVPLVVCSRLADYKAYKEILGLNGAVTLQPLDDAQIEQYLQAATVGWLWENIRQDPDFMNPTDGLARSPLLLTILVLASEALPPEMWQPEIGVQARRRVLFEAYIQRRLARKYYGGKNLPATKNGKKPYPNDAKTQRWLGWLAARLIEENQTEFFIEKLQPRFLKEDELYIYALLLTSLVVVAIGWFTGATIAIAIQSLFGFFLGTLYSLIIGFLYLFIRLYKWHFKDDIRPFDRLIFSFKSIKENANTKIQNNILYGGEYGLAVGVFVSIYSKSEISLSRGAFEGVLLGSLAYGVVAGLISCCGSDEISERVKDNQGVYSSFSNSLSCAIFFVPSGVVIAAVLYTRLYGQFPNSSVLIPLATGFSFLFGSANGGMNPVNEHIALRATLYLFGHGPWNYSKFLRYCTERGFLQRVGGGYRFVHALLREHFAAQYGDLKPSSALYHSDQN